jgi:hypothetical protein
MVKYLDWLRDSLSKSEEKTRRALLYTLVGAAVFELLAVDSKSELSLGPLKIDNPSSVVALLPVFVAFFFLEAFVSIEKYDAGRTVFRELLERWQPPAAGNEIDAIVLPPEALYVGSAAVNTGPAATPQENAESSISIIVMLGAILLAFSFEVHAFVVLFSRLGASSVLVWLALILVVLIAGAIVYYGRADSN